MARNLLFFADGTWQSADNKNQSNVIKLFSSLAGNNTVGAANAREQERSYPGADGSNPHVAKYINGVGSDTNALAAAAGGVLGLGLITNVLRGYTYLSRQYQPGDAIFLAGFSRGAYTVRTLASLVRTMGLLDWKALALNPVASDDRGYGYASAAWYAWQQRRPSAPDVLGSIQSLITETSERWRGAGFAPIYTAPVPIHAVAVWDTVGSLGIPASAIGAGHRVDALQFVDTVLGDGIARAFHAVATDEQRGDFTPTLWTADARVKQVAFPGAHADVGGGYPASTSTCDESDLSDLSALWMAAQLRGEGVEIALPNPRDNAALGPQHEPWEELPYKLEGPAPRDFRAQPLAVSDVTRARFARAVPVISPRLLELFGSQRWNETYKAQPLVDAGLLPAPAAPD